MALEFKLKPLQFYRGCAATLDEPTAVAELAVRGSSEPMLLKRIAAQLSILDLDDVFWGGSGTWPGAFVATRRNGAAGVAEWLVALTVALQRSVREPVWQGDVLRARGSTMRLALPYRRAAVATSALTWAMRYLAVCSSAGSSGAFPKLVAAIQRWQRLAKAGGVSPLSARFYAAARRRDIPVEIEAGFLQLGHGRNAERLDGSFTGRTGNIATRLARNKAASKQILHAAGLPVARGAVVATLDQAKRVAETVGWPVVVKPSNQDRGIGVAPGLRDEAMLAQAYAEAARHSPGAVLIEKHVQGADHRLLVVGGRLIAAARRTPGSVCGDGRKTVAQLVEDVNKDPRRGADPHSLLVRLAIDDEAQRSLSAQGLSPDSVVARGNVVPLRFTANIASGGTAEDVTGSVHPDNRLLAERAAVLLGLDIAGVDFLCPDISRSWREVGGVICEVNAQPGFRPHWLADPKRDVNGEIIDWLFKEKRARIPIAAVTGTNGKTTVCRMLQHIWLETGVRAGITTTHGVHIGREEITRDNLAGQPGGRIILNDPTAEAAVIEMSRKALMLFGHPTDRYDVAALLNVQDDHIGADGVDSLEAMANVKTQVLQRASVAAVVNADDPLCLAALRRVRRAAAILVASRGDNAAVREHVARNGRAVYIEPRNGARWIVCAEGPSLYELMPLSSIPATMNGLLRYNETNASFAVAMAWAHGIAHADIRRALSSFRNTPDCNPGRYNFIEGLPFKVLLDFGHNPDGVKELLNVVRQIPVTGQRVLACTIGYRHRSHLETMKMFPRIFSRIFLAQDEKFFGSTAVGFGSEDPLGAMLRAAEELLMPLLDGRGTLATSRSRAEALQKALAACRPGDLLVALAEPHEALDVFERYREEIARAEPLRKAAQVR